MTNRLALFLGLIIVGIFLADRLYFHLDLHIILGKKLAEFSEYLAFWR